jgi:hypothetical protein
MQNRYHSQTHCRRATSRSQPLAFKMDGLMDLYDASSPKSQHAKPCATRSGHASISQMWQKTDESTTARASPSDAKILLANSSRIAAFVAHET